MNMEYDDEDFPVKPKRVTRQPHEMRDTILYLRVTRQEYDRLYRYARARKATMSYMVRAALEEKFPDIFAEANRHIRKPRKPVEVETPTQILTSWVDGSVKINDICPSCGQPSYITGTARCIDGFHIT